MHRRKKIVDSNIMKWCSYTGMLKHFNDLNDHQKWELVNTIFQKGQLPSKLSYENCRRYSNFSIKGGVEFKFNYKNNVVTNLPTNDLAGFIIFATGFIFDMGAREEFNFLNNKIIKWKDREIKKKEGPLGECPYLGNNFQLISENKKYKKLIEKVFCFNYGAFPSHGLSGSSITGLKYSIPKIVYKITKDLFIDNYQFYLNDLKNYNEKELSL